MSQKPWKLRLIVYLGISLYVVLSQCQIAESQDLYELSYSRDMLPPVTPQPSTTTTKKSSILKGIKNWFRGESSTTAATIPLNPPAGPIHSPTNTLSTPRPPQQAPLPSPPYQTPTASGGLPNRDFVNANNRPLSPVTPPSSGAAQSSQFSGNRDFVNANVNRGNLPPNPMPIVPTSGVSGIVQPTSRNHVMPQPPPTPVNSGASSIPPRQGSSSTGNTSPQGTRDFVNPNPRPTAAPTLPTRVPSISGQQYPQPPQRVDPTPHSSTTRIVTNPTPPSNSRRDFVNTSPRPSPSTPQPVSATSAWANTPQPPTGQRDYVNTNPNINPQRSDRDFPPLPVPNRPPSPTRQSGHPGSPQHQPTVNPPSPTGVSFIPRQPSSGTSQGTTPKTTELATDEEITTLTETLFTKDVNNQNRHITINYQGHTRSSDRTDEAADPLLQVNQEALQSPTVARMRPLFNNYELDTTVNEYVTPMERREENELLDAVLATTVMRQAMLFLQNKGLVTPDPKTHRDLLKTIWFTMYSRGGGRIGSSGFEHVFLSEVKNGTVTGLHNWVYFFDEEQLGHIDYKGYIKKLELGNKGAILKYRFNFNGIEKPVNSMFIGTSPELEMALYTVCFQVRADRDCPVSLGGQRFTIQTYTFRYRGKKLIGSAFPEI